MEDLTLIKQLLEIDIDDMSKDSVLNHFIKRSKDIILAYCNVTELSSEYSDTIVDFAAYLYKNRNNTGFIEKKEGERSIAFEIGIPENIRIALPLPKIKVGGY